MAEEATSNATVSVPASGGLTGLFRTDAATPDAINKQMVLLTWFAFLIAAILLHRLAWKPILRALDKREQGIRDSLDEADRARKQAEKSAEQSRLATAQAMAEARAMTEEARQNAARTAVRLEQEAHEKVRRMLDDAAKEIDATRRRAEDDLRREAGQLAIQLSEQMLAEHLTPAQRQAYETRAIEKLPT